MHRLATGAPPLPTFAVPHKRGWLLIPAPRRLLAQGGIILGPVRDPAPLLGDTMTAISIGLERHRGSRVIGGVVHLRQPSPEANRPIRATNSLIGNSGSFAAGSGIMRRPLCA